jgi:nicotinamidase-related amidase
MLPFDAFVIVDMQPHFYKDNPEPLKLVNYINRTMERFRAENKPIFVLEYGHSVCGYTDDRIKLPNSAIVLKKFRDDGSEEIEEYITSKKMPVQHILICGINRCWCVKSTVLGLENFGYKTTLGHTRCNAASCKRNGHTKIRRWR